MSVITIANPFDSPAIYGVRHYLSEIWKCRYFWVSLTQMDLRNRYRRSALGIGWSLLQPICFTAIICVVFSTVFKRDMREFGPYLMCGLSFWNYIVHVSIQGSQCFFNGEPYIRQHPAPIAIYPLRMMLGGAFHFGLSLFAAFCLTLLLRGFPNVWALATLVPTLSLLLVFGWSVAVLTGVLAVFFPDTKHLLEVGLQILFYATPIMYPRELLASSSSLASILQLNPMSVLVGMVRDPIVYSEAPSMFKMGIMFAITATIFLIAVAALAKFEKKIVFFL